MTASTTTEKAQPSASAIPFSIRLAKFWQRYGWWVIGVLWGIALVLGYWGFWIHAQVTDEAFSQLDLLYLTFQLISMNSGAVAPPVPWQLEIARFLLPLLAAWTIIRSFVTVFHEHWQHFLLHRIWRDHVVICGLSRKGWHLARGFNDQGVRVAVIELDEDNDFVGACRERGITVLIGDATSPEILQRAAVARARHIIAVTGDDGINAEIGLQVENQLRKASRRRFPPTCTIHLVNPQLYNLARVREMTTGAINTMRLELFNTFDRGAQLLWQQYCHVSTEESTPDPSLSDCANHVLLVGMGGFGETLAAYIARDRYFQMRMQPDNPIERVRITVIDKDADWKCLALKQRYPQLEKACLLVPLTMSIGGPEFLKGDYLAGGAGYPPPEIVYVCFDDDSLGLQTGLSLYHRLSRNGNHNTPVVVRMSEAGGLARLLATEGDAQDMFANLHAFGLIDNTCTPEIIVGGTHMFLAQNIHDSYVRHLLAQGETPETNENLVPWDQLTQGIRQSNLAAADSIGRFLHELGYSVVPLMDWESAFKNPFSNAEIEQLAKMEHTRFIEERKKQGWEYGEKKDIHKKTNPTLIEWDKLPEGEQEKTRNAIREWPLRLALAGFEIVPIASTNQKEPMDRQ